MKKLIYLYVIMSFIIACGNNEPQKDSLNTKDEILVSQETKNTDTSKKHDKLVLSLRKYLGADSRIDSLKIFNSDGSLYGFCVNGVLNIGGEKLNLLDVNEEKINAIIPSIAVFPEYNVWYTDAERNEDSDIFTIRTKEGKKNVRGKSIDVLSYDDFLRQQWIGLTKESPLLKTMNIKSDTVQDYLKYDYKITRTNGDWIYVELSDHVEPGDESYESLGIKREGWVKWRDNGTVKVKFYYGI